MARLTHLDARGKARMVDVGAKPVTRRVAIARGEVTMAPATLRLLTAGELPKGDVLAVARVAGVMAAKRTSDLIPLCHPLRPTQIEVDCEPDPAAGCVAIESRVKVADRTGVEMEALVAVAVAALTIYDMCKAVDRAMTIGGIRLVSKSGGRSGTYRRPGER